MAQKEALYYLGDEAERSVWGTRLPEEEARRQAVERAREEGRSTKVRILRTAREEVEFLLENRIRPYLRMEGGDVELREVRETEGEVVLSLRGACALCPSALFTFTAGIQRTLRAHLPWLRRVRPAEEPQEPDFGFRRLWKNSGKETRNLTK